MHACVYLFKTDVHIFLSCLASGGGRWPWLPLSLPLLLLLCLFSFASGLPLCLYRWWAIPSNNTCMHMRIPTGGIGCICLFCLWLMVALPSCAYAILSYCALVMLGYILWPWLPFFQLLFWLLCPFSFGIGLVLCLYRWWAIPLWLNMHVYAYPLWFLVTCGCLFPCPYVIFPCVTMLWLIYGWVTCGGLSCPSLLLV